MDLPTFWLSWNRLFTKGRLAHPKQSLQASPYCTTHFVCQFLVYFCSCFLALLAEHFFLSLAGASLWDRTQTTPLMTSVLNLFHAGVLTGCYNMRVFNWQKKSERKNSNTCGGGGKGTWIKPQIESNRSKAQDFLTPLRNHIWNVINIYFIFLRVKP